MAKRILVIEDDVDINDLIAYNLKKEGYEVASLYQGEGAFEQALKLCPDLIVLDVMLPGVDGLDICRYLRADEKTKNIPVLMLTARSEESDQLVGLQMGADDYMLKPFSPKLLLARVKVLLRRGIASSQTSLEQKRERHGLIIDLLKHKVYYHDQSIALTQIEFDILEYLSRFPGRVFSREQILDGVWKEGKFIVDRAVDVHIRGLRKKMGGAQDLIETVRGVGYCFKE